MYETFCFKIKKPIKAVNNGLQLTMKLPAPAETLSCPWLRNKLYKKIPILGVCLGHQIIGQVFGSKIIQAKKLMHGKTSKIQSF